MKYGDFCTFCAAMMGTDAWPRQCPACKQFMYRNQTPVGLAVIPVYKHEPLKDTLTFGLFVIRRGKNMSKAGELALAGGFLEGGETWQQGIAREANEETGGGIQLDADLIDTFHVETSLVENVLLVFGLAQPGVPYDAIRFVANAEVDDYAVLWKPEKLAFPTHTKVCKMFFDQFGR
jgi:8-oxo-dGTP diphosphatase